MNKKLYLTLAILFSLSFSNLTYATNNVERDIAETNAINSILGNTSFQPAPAKKIPAKPKVPVFTERDKQEAEKYLTGNEYDVAGSGNYAGMRLLMNHKASGAYNIYFTATKEGSIESKHVATEYLGPSMNESITITTKNGKVLTATRGDWYKVFEALDILNKSSEGNPYGISPELYNEYFAYVMGHQNAERIANTYIKQVYFPKNFPNEY